MYKINDLAVIIPTKDRPKQVKRHLKSLISQHCDLGSVIVVASGEDIQDIVLNFADKLPIQYYYTEPGQIRQRNIGISHLNKRIKLVASMDDDITYEKNAIKNMIEFWNLKSGDIGGVGYNIINEEEQKSSIFLSLIDGYKGMEPGRVLKSGVNTSIANVKEDIDTDWLNGGGTVWKKEILLKYTHKEINSKWALYEDVIFSYPLSKKYNYFICSNAKIKTEFIPAIDRQAAQSYFMGISFIFWRLYFVENNQDLSRFHYYKRAFIQIWANLFKGIIYLDKFRFIQGVGMLVGLTKVLFLYKYNNQKILQLIENI